MTVILNSPDSPLNNPLPPKQPPLWWIVLNKTIHYLTELRSRHVFRAHSLLGRGLFCGEFQAVFILPLSS